MTAGPFGVGYVLLTFQISRYFFMRTPRLRLGLRTVLRSRFALASGSCDPRVFWPQRASASRAALRSPRSQEVLHDLSARALEALVVVQRFAVARSFDVDDDGWAED